ncbi:aldehyde dehydrogenase family protein [Maritimibacter sp. DP07]|uniref:Aldehyde dehydrogenase family protein n=1 Tax=Maritimibacter harenae TaxID=2606218 RepID=A0A845M1V6_9RHOB|nr:aldehyde dehydrogenase family protein [Maritimibacter harenae]MZR11697.1 aldehyde dehydrogenase family protein [Maritimibacter harenae]
MGGRFVEAADGASFEVENPATGEFFARAAQGSATDIDRALRAARCAFDEGPWPNMSPVERERVLHRLADLVEANAERLAAVETLDNGMPQGLARDGALPMGIQALRHYAGWPTKLTGDTVPLSAEGKWHAYTMREPGGVVGAICAWNFPVSMACGKLAPALAAGCTVVLKPAEQTPLSAILLAELVAEAGVPEGVVNIVTGFGREAGQALVYHPMADKISFTGSTATGRHILETKTKSLKRVTLELGGESPNMIFADADLEAAIPAAAMAFIGASGQVCVARSRLFIERSVFEEVSKGIAEFAAGLKVGNGADPETVIGPLVSQTQFDRVKGFLDLGSTEGARRLGGGTQGGYFVKPTVLADVDGQSRLMREEIFGPVVVATPFDVDDLSAAAALANDTFRSRPAHSFTAAGCRGRSST